MITETIQYKNFNNEDDSRTMHFHISEAILMENMAMRDRVAALAEILGGPKRQLNIADIQEIIHLVKWLMSLSYGIKSIDGTSFDQDDPVGTGAIWHKFKVSPAYNAFLLSLFKEPEKAIQFIVAVLPEELSKQATDGVNPDLQKVVDEARQQSRLAPGTRIVDGVPVVADAPVRIAPEPTRTPTDAAPEEPDIDALMAQAWEAETEAELEDQPVVKEEITLKRAAFMREKLSPAQFEKFMEDYDLVDAEGDKIDAEGNKLAVTA